MTVEIDEEYPWHLEWLWVSGYSTLATLVMVFNLLIIFSVGKNKYLHFSLHYAVIAMALRSVSLSSSIASSSSFSETFSE